MARPMTPIDLWRASLAIWTQVAEMQSAAFVEGMEVFTRTALTVRPGMRPPVLPSACGPVSTPKTRARRAAKPKE